MTKRRKNESKPDDAVIAERRLEALELRKSGASYRAIATHLKISHEQARQDIMTCLAELAEKQDEDTAKYRQLELERLDRLQLALWSRAVSNTAPDTRAVMALLKLSERRAKLLGLDAPQNVKLETWQDDYIAAIKAGRIDFEALKAVLNDQPGLAEQLFIAAGVPITAGDS